MVLPCTISARILPSLAAAAAAIDSSLVSSFDLISIFLVSMALCRLSSLYSVMKKLQKSERVDVASAAMNSGRMALS